MFDEKAYMKEYRQKNQDKIKVQKQKWYYKHKKRLKLKNDEYRQNHLGRHKELNKKWYLDNQEKIKKKAKDYYQNNKKEVKEYRQKNQNKIYLQKKEYRQKNPEKRKEEWIRHLKKYSIPFSMKFFEYGMALNSWSKTVKKQDGKACQICGSTDKLHAHHILEKKHFPELSLNPNNGITLCVPCHNQAHGRQLNRPVY